MEKRNIRNAGPGDIEQIMLIERSSFHEHIRESRSVFLERIAFFREGFLVLEIDDHVCGYISSEIWDYAENITATSLTLNHRISETHTTTGSELYISSIGILEDYRGKGYGNLLFTELSRRMIEKYAISSMICLFLQTGMLQGRFMRRMVLKKCAELLASLIREMREL